jgi:hypothetical protein
METFTNQMTGDPIPLGATGVNMRILGWGCVFVTAAMFIAMLVVAQIGCPIPTCKGPDGDAWMPAFFFAPFGLPALVASIFFIAKKIWPNSPVMSAVGLGLKYLALAIIGLAFLTTFILGYLHGRERTSHQIQVQQ